MTVSHWDVVYANNISNQALMPDGVFYSSAKHKATMEQMNFLTPTWNNIIFAELWIIGNHYEDKCWLYFASKISFDKIFKNSTDKFQCKFNCKM